MKGGDGAQDIDKCDFPRNRIPTRVQNGVEKLLGFSLPPLTSVALHPLDNGLHVKKCAAYSIECIVFWNRLSIQYSVKYTSRRCSLQSRVRRPHEPFDPEERKYDGKWYSQEDGNNLC